MPEVQTHPLRCVPAQIVIDTQGTLGRACLQFVGEGIVIAAIAVVQKTADRAEKLDGIAGQFISADRAEARIVPFSC